MFAAGSQVGVILMPMALQADTVHRST